MSLKVVKRKGRDTLYVRGTVGRQSIYESTGTNNPKQAEAFRAKREAELWQESVYGKRAVITFDSAAAAYLAAGLRSDTTITHIERLLGHFRGRKVASIKQQDLDDAYRAILTAGSEAKGATKIRAVLTPLRAILEFSAIRGWCDKPAFERPKVEQVRMQFLRPEKATALVNEAAPHIRPLLVFLIATGARMSEALELEWQDVDLEGAALLSGRSKATSGTLICRQWWLLRCPTSHGAMDACSGRRLRSAICRGSCVGLLAILITTPTGREAVKSRVHGPPHSAARVCQGMSACGRLKVKNGQSVHSFRKCLPTVCAIRLQGGTITYIGLF